MCEDAKHPPNNACCYRRARRIAIVSGLVYRVAHISDLHVLDLKGVPVWRFLNKRITGYANLRFKRSHHHSQETLRQVCRALKNYAPDHVIITGDVTNLALQSEFEAAKSLLEEELGFEDARISLVPGNHDAYTKGAAISARVEHYFGTYMKSDVNVPKDATFPFVHLRGPLALIGLSSAIAQPPLFACGEVSAAQREALEQILAHPSLEGRTRVYLNHHPLFDLGKDQRGKGLKDAELLSAVLQPGIFCHGHLHTRTSRSMTIPQGTLEIYGATSASMTHENHDRVAGFNAYEFNDAGALERTFAHLLDGSKRQIPRVN